MAISQRRYIDIASAVIGSSAVAMQSLDCRVFTPSTLLATNEILEFSTANDVLSYFGLGDEYDFASKYFALTTPAPVSKAKKIQFAGHIIEDRKNQIFSNTISSIEDFNLIKDGSLTITKEDSTSIIIDKLNFSNVVSYSEIASVINSKKDISNNNIVFEYVNGDFIIKSEETIKFEYGTLEDLLGLSNPLKISKKATKQSMLQAFVSAYAKNNSFGSAYFLNRGNLKECIDLANYNAGLNVYSMLFIQVKGKRTQSLDSLGATIEDIINGEDNLEEFSNALIKTSSTALILELEDEENEYLAHLPAGLLSATDYTRTNGTLNYMFRQAGVTLKQQVTNDLTANKLDKLRINYYGLTASAGSDIRFFQRAFLCGEANSPLDMSVHANEQWLKARFTQLWFNLMLSTRGVSANLDGKLRGLSVINEVVQEALNNGTILKGKTFTITQKLAIADATLDDEAWIVVMNNGCWFDVKIKERTGESNIAEYYLDYILIYAKGDWVRKVTGSHNLV